MTRLSVPAGRQAILASGGCRGAPGHPESRGAIPDHRGGEYAADLLRIAIDGIISCLKEQEIYAKVSVLF
jgi:hypothetical protein